MSNWNENLIQINYQAIREACLECVLNNEKPIRPTMVAKQLGIPVELAENALERLFCQKKIYRRDTHVLDFEYMVYTEGQRQLDEDYKQIQLSRHHVVKTGEKSSVDLIIPRHIIGEESVKQHQIIVPTLKRINNVTVWNFFNYAKATLERKGYTIRGGYVFPYGYRVT